MTDADYLEPLKAQLRTAEKEAGELKKQYEEKQREVGRLSKGLYALDPAWAAEQRRKKKSPGGNRAKRLDGSYAIAEERVEAVEGYIRAHFKDGHEFKAGDLPQDEIGMSSATRNQALIVLHERGVIRVLSIGVGRGGGKVYALTTE